MARKKPDAGEKKPAEDKKPPKPPRPYCEVPRQPRESRWDPRRVAHWTTDGD